jgi:tetratricopeptide (TPR) repeat protein
MMRRFPKLLLACVLPALAFSAPGEASASGQKIYVAPYAPLYHQVPVELGVRTAERIGRELAEQGKLVPVEGPSVQAGSGAPAGAEPDARARAQALRNAENLLAQAREQASALRFAQAARRYRQALDQYEANLVHITDFQVFVDAHFELAVALFRAGREEEAEGYLADVVRLDPERSIEGGDYPPVFVRSYEAVRGRLLRATRGSLAVMTTPPGATVTLNGKQLGRTPVRLTQLVPGRHYLRVQAPGVAPEVRTVDVAAREPTNVEVSFGGELEGPVAELVGSLARNRLDESAVREARRVARSLGVDYVLMGVLQRGPRTFQVRSYLLDVADGQVARLSDMRIDFDFLGAALEIFRLSEEVGAAADAFPPAVAVPSTVFDGASQAAISFEEVVAGPPAPREDPAAAASRTAAPEPAVASAARGQERGRPTGPVAPVAPTRPAGPVAPAEPAQEPERRPTREGPVGASPIAPAEEGAAAERRPFAPVVPQEAEAEPERDRQVVQVGGARGRLLDPDVETGSHRFAAVDIDEVAVIEDEDGRRRRRDGAWPWWAWGLVAVGAAGLGAGGYYAATEMGGNASTATVTFEW